MSTTLNAEDIKKLTDRIEQAQVTATAIPKLTEEYPAMTIADGYSVQMALRQRWLDQGQRQTGWKAGLTSKAKMIQMSVDVPSIGFLMAGFARPDGSTIQTNDLVHPRVECEVSFVLKKDLSGLDVTREQVLDATDFVLPSIEIIDSRFSGFKFDMPSVIADNSSSARYVVGGWARDVRDLDIQTLGVVMEKNGVPVEMAASTAVMGHPADAIALVCKVLHDFGLGLKAGDFVMSGGITAAVAVQAGDFVQARFQELGSVSMRFA
jgi:2-oxo-3-hexenedioate decarboxylase